MGTGKTHRDVIPRDQGGKAPLRWLRALIPLTFRGQAVLFLVPTIVLMSLVYTIESVSTERKILRKELVKKGETIATIAARTAELPVLSENFAQLRSSALSIMEIKDVAFVSFLNKRFELLLQEGRRYPLGPPPLNNADMAVTLAERGDILEFTVPVVTVRADEGLFFFEGADSPPPLKEHIGWVRIGLSKEVMAKSEREVMVRGGLLAVLFTIAGISLVYVFISIATRPLHALTTAAKEVRAGEHAEVRVISPRSEIGRLSAEFNRMSRAIKEREDFLNNIVENIPDMIYVKDAEELRFVRFNRAGEELLGCSREELTGRSSHDLFPRDLADLYVAKDREVLRTRQPVDIPEDLIHTAHRGERIFHSKKIPILDDDGKPRYLLGISEDITERKRAEDELERHRDHLEELVGERTAELRIAKEQAESASRAKSDFLSNMSHELRTPLNAILGYAQILKRQDNLTETQRQQLAIMHSSGVHLLTLINDILDVGKIEAQKMEVEEVPFDLAALLVQVFNLTRLNAEEKDLCFRYEAETPLPSYVRGDERKLRQVLLNLLSNAVKYTRRGSVTLRVSYGRAGESLFRCEVADTGVGIPADKLDAIFEPFAQLAAKGQSREGTGLGLSISKRLLALMQGKMGVESVLGKGSTFWLELALPALAEADVALEKTECNVVGYRGERKRILVVDDSIGNTSMLISLLEPLGFELDTAQTGREAVHAAKEHRPDLVLLDLVMPDMDGLEAATLIRRDPALAHTRIIGASATETDSAHKVAFAAACDDFVEKPIRIDSLLEKIGSQLLIRWVTGQAEAVPPADVAGTARREELFAIPPPHRLEELLELAMRGDMSKIEIWADKLETENHEYCCFADRLRELAGGFRTKAVLALVEQAMGAGNEA